MAYETNDFKRILTLVLFLGTLPIIAPTNINCSGRAFHCVNSTHFMICVDLGGGLSTTIDDFVIPCPATTVCHENNAFECDFPDIEVTTPSLQVIHKQSDTSETTSVINSVNIVTASMPTSELLSVFKENITATTLPIPEEVIPVFKLEVLKDIKNRISGNSENITDTNIQVNSSLINSAHEIVNDKQTSNKTITTISVADNNKHLEPAVETSILKAANTTFMESLDTVTSVIGLINLISTDHLTVVSSKPSSDVLTSLDTSYDDIASTTEQYSTKPVKTQGEILETVTEKIIIPTEIIFGEKSLITDEVNTTPMINTLIEKEINNSTEYINKTDSNNQTIVKLNILSKSNSKTELVSETTTEYLVPVKINNISEPVTVVASPQTTKDKPFVHLRLVDLISVNSNKEKVPSIKSSSNYLETLIDNTETTINQQSTTLSDIPVTAEVTSTIPILYTNVQNVNKADTDTDVFTELNSTVEINTTEKVPKKNTKYFVHEAMTIAKTIVPITKETNIINTTEKISTSGELIENHSLVEEHITATQPLEIIMTTDSSIKIIEDLYQIKQAFKETQNTKNLTPESFKSVVNASIIDTINVKPTDPSLLPPTTMKYPAIQISTTETIQNEFSVHATKVTNELPEIKVSSRGNEPFTTNVKNDTLLYHTSNSTANNTINVKTLDNELSTNINNNKGAEPTTFPLTAIKYPTIQMSPIENGQNEFIIHPIEATSELLATTGSINVYEPVTDNIGTNTFLHVRSTPTLYEVTSDAVADTNVKDLTSQSDIVTNPQGFTPDTIELKVSDGYTSKHRTITQEVTIYPETNNPGSLNPPENLGIISLHENFNADQSTTDVDSITTTYLNIIENSATTPFPSDVIKNNSLSDIDHITTNDVNTQDVLPLAVLPPSNYYETKLTSTTPETVSTTSMSIATKTLQQVSTNTPELVNIYRVPATTTRVPTKYNSETSTTFPVHLADTTNIKNDSDILMRVLPLHNQANENIGKENQLNIISSTIEPIGNSVSSTMTTAGFAVLNNTKKLDLNTKRSKDLVFTEPIIYEIDANTDVNKTKTVNPINGKNNDTSSLSADHINQSENITIVSVSHVSKSLVNVIPNRTTQQSSSYPSLNDNVAIIKSQNSNAYVSATDNIPDYNLMQVGEPIPQKIPEVIVSFVETKVGETSDLATSNSHTLPVIEINTEHVNINPTKTAVNYVAQITNDDIFSTEATQSNKVHKMEADSFLSSVSSFTPGIAVSRDIWAVPDTGKITTVTDSAFLTSFTQSTPKVVVDEIINITTEDPLSTSKVTETEIDTFNTEPSLLTSRVSVEQVILTTEPTYTSIFTQIMPLAVTDKTNQDVMSEIKTSDLSQNVQSIVKHNVLQPTEALHIAGITTVQVTSELTPTIGTFTPTTPSLAMIGKKNQDVLPEIKTTGFPQNVFSTVNHIIPQTTPALHIEGVATTPITSDLTPTTDTFVQTTPSLAMIGKTDQNVLPGIKNNSPQLMKDITTESFIGSLSVPDSMVETIKEFGNKVSGTYLQNTISTAVISNNPTVHINYSVKSVNNIIDHERIIIGNISKNNLQNTTNKNSVNINKAEVVNHTESDRRPDVNIDGVQMKESSTEEADTSKTSVMNSGMDVHNKTFLSDSPIIAQITSIEFKPVDINYSNIIAVTPSPLQVTEKESTAPRNYTHSNGSTVNENIETFDVKRFQVRDDFKNSTNSYNLSNTKSNTTTSYYNLSLKNSTINDELEQHLISTNHTITAEIQAHLNESDKQSNKTNYEQTFKVTSTHNTNLTIIKLNVASKNKSTTAISDPVFDCSNHTRGKYADKKDCRKFYTCIGNLQPILGTCPNNTVFSEINKQCTKNLSHCVRNNQFRCLFEGRFSDFFKENIYYICVKHRVHGFIRYKLKCQNDYHLNKDSVKCEKNEEISSQSASSVSETNNDESKPEPKSEKMVSTDNFECENEGKFPYTKYCSKYYVCTKIKNVYRRKITKCASDEVFDKKKKKCVESDSGEC